MQCEMLSCSRELPSSDNLIQRHIKTEELSAWSGGGGDDVFTLERGNNWLLTFLINTYAPGKWRKKRGGRDA
jgi:hypothetical protein